MMECKAYGVLSDGRLVDEYVLTNASGMEVRIITYGGTITSIRVPDRHGNFQNIMLGFNDLQGYVTYNAFFSCITGRYANRIGGGRFTLDGTTYTLAINNGPNHIHGGVVGFDKRVWKAEPVSGSSEEGLKLSYFSPDGEEGYPGNLDASVTYTMTEANELRVECCAVTDKPTIVNLTNHTKFNLSGDGMGSVSGHIMMINADFFTPTDATQIPTGELAPVEGTPFDFRKPKVIGPGQRSTHPQIVIGRGYDHNWVINRPTPYDGAPVLAARVYDPLTGRMVDVLTNAPGIQFYGGNFLDGTTAGSGGLYRQGDGLALEAEGYPDAPNKPNFPSVVLRPGETYCSTTIFRFSTD
ncbi:MAG: galactose mutarotase [Chloroflexi bacterium]|nr:galactose mutarotase [Chloroflexota bacterium]